MEKDFLMENNILNILDCKDKAFLDSYNKIFTLEWYPKFFVKDIYEAFYINSSNFLAEFISYIALYSNDNNIYLKVKNYNEDCGYKCYLFPNSKAESLKNNIIFETTFYTMDEGFVVFGDSLTWAFYVGEDLYDYGMKGDYEDFSFIFGSPCIREMIINFFKTKYSNAFDVKEEFKNKYFQTATDPKEKITAIII